jgi:hypothetical protein
MSYPRNAATPPIVAVGAIYLLADGTIQTTGASVRVKTGTGSWGIGAGTLACDSTSGIWTYAPTQGETDAESFIVGVYKSSSTSAQVTVATSASATAGYSGVDWGKLTAATTTVNLSGTTISTTQAVASVSGAVGSVTGAVGSVTGAVGSVTARVTANTDQWGGVTVTGMPLPTASYTTPPTVAQVVTGVYAALPGDHTVNGSYGVRFLLALNSNRIVQVTGSHHVAADVHEFQADVITAAALAASAVTELQAGLATSAAVAAVQSDVTTLLGRITATLFSGITYLSRWLGALAGKTTDASTQTEIRATTAGATYTITTDSLEAIRDNSGGGGSGDASQTTLLEVQGTVNGIAASLSGTTVSVSSRVSAAGEITLWAGDDCRVRSGTQIDVTITDVGGAIYTRLSGIGLPNLVWGAARIVQPAGAITGTVAALTQAGAGASQTLKLSIEITGGGSDLRAADDYTWQIVSSEQHGTEYDQQVELEGSLVLRRRVAVPVY